MVQRDNEIRVTASLPYLHIEVRHRDEGEAGEVVSVQMRAVPNVEALMPSVVRALPVLFVAANPLLAGPMRAWAQMVQLLWRPWLEVLPSPETNVPLRRH